MLNIIFLTQSEKKINSTRIYMTTISGNLIQHCPIFMFFFFISFPRFFLSSTPFD